MELKKEWPKEKMKLTKEELIQELKEALKNIPATRHLFYGRANVFCGFTCYTI